MPKATLEAVLRSFLFLPLSVQSHALCWLRQVIPYATIVLRQVSQEPEGFDPGAAPPFGLTDLRKAIPEACWQKDTTKSMVYMFRDVAYVGALAAAAAYINSWWVWPAYWIAQGTMFWALFVVGHDCGHGSFSNNKALNNFVGHLTHSSSLVPFHGWRISHRTHHANHGHVENDESWTPITKSQYQGMEAWARAGTPLVTVCISLFYLFVGSVEQAGSHFDPHCKLFAKNERNDIIESRNWVIGMGVILAALAFLEGPAMLFKTYIVPYWINVIWLDAVTYLHHHGPEDNTPRVPWYRGEEWSYLRGGLSTIDRDYGLFNNIHHDIGTHVVHHIFPQIPHYNLIDATKGAKTVMGEYYREPKPSSGPLPLHLLQPLVRSFSEDHYVNDHGDVVYYKKDPTSTSCSTQR
eukprot:jgi/Chlat1/5787/Chrsp387S09019